MLPVNNPPTATILHTDGECCICANFPVSMYSVMDSDGMDDIWDAPVAWQAEIGLNVLV